MAKSTTVREIEKWAERNDTTLHELGRQYQMVCQNGQWDDPNAEVLVPNSFPIGQRVPTNIVII